VNLPGFLRGMPQVFLQEFRGNLKSVRFLIMALVATLVIVGGAYGISGFTAGFGGGARPIVVWPHAAVDGSGNHIAVAWVSDGFGAPLARRAVTFANMTTRNLIGEVTTNAEGFARLNVGNASEVLVEASLGTFENSASILWGFVEPYNFTVASSQDDLDGDFALDDFSLHVLDLAGDPVAGTVRVNGNVTGSLDAHGFLLLELSPGQWNITLDVAGETFVTTAYVSEGGELPFFTGPDFVLLTIASLSSWIVSIFAIVISFDAVSKERVQGTMDLLLSRPASRTGVLLGKFLSSFVAVALPVTLVNLAGIGAISAASGQAPTGSLATAFVGYSLLLIVYYVFLMLAVSTLVKTSGTAVLFGVLIWLLLNILYPIVTFILSAALSGGDPATQFRILQSAALANPSSIVGALIALAAPAALVGAGGGTALDASALGTAAVFWFLLLFALALWTFQKKASE